MISRLPRPQRLPAGRASGSRRPSATASASPWPGSRASAASTAPRSRRSAGRGSRRRSTSCRRPPSSSATGATRAAGRRLLRPRRHPAAARRPRGRRGGPPRGARPRPDARSRRSRSSGSPRARSKAAATAIEAALEEAGARPLGAGPAPAGAGRDPGRGAATSPARGPPLDELAAIGRELPVAGAGGRAATWRAGACCWPRATPAGAAQELRAAIRGWREVGAPYEVARARALLAMALRGLERRRRRGPGAPGGRSTSSCGSAPRWTRRRRSGCSRDAEDRRHAPEQVRQGVHVHRHRGLARRSPRRSATRPGSGCCAGTTTRSAGSSPAGGGEVVNSTGDGFFVAFAVGAPGDRLRDRDPAGAARAPGVDRVRAADPDRPPHGRGEPARAATTAASGVHVAARVGALAGAGEILATVETLREAGTARRAEPREVSVKGVSTPLQVVPVAWS